MEAQPAVRRALTVYLWVFCLVNIAGWVPEIAGRRGGTWLSADYSALFHASATFDSRSDFADLTDFARRMQHLSGPALAEPGAAFSYPPAAVYALDFFLTRFSRPVLAFSAGMVAVLALLGAVLVHTLRTQALASLRSLSLLAAASTILFGFPQIFAGFRANLEWIDVGLTAFALICFSRRRYLAAALLLGLAIAIKPFPIVFCLLFLWRRRYMEAAVVLAVFAYVSLAALVALGPTLPVAIHSLAACWAGYFKQYVLTVRLEQELRFNHSLLDTIKLVLWFVYDHQQYDPRVLIAGVPDLPIWARLDLWARLFAAVAVAGIACIGWRFRRMPTLNGIFALSIAELLLPYSSAEYTLMLMLVPWGFLLIVLVCDGRAGLTSGQMLRLLIPCALLFSPLSVLNCFSGFAKTLCLVWLLREVWMTPLRSSWLDTGRKVLREPPIKSPVLKERDFSPAN